MQLSIRTKEYQQAVKYKGQEECSSSFMECHAGIQWEEAGIASRPRGKLRKYLMEVRIFKRETQCRVINNSDHSGKLDIIWKEDFKKKKRGFYRNTSIKQ